MSTSEDVWDADSAYIEMLANEVHPDLLRFHTFIK